MEQEDGEQEGDTEGDAGSEDDEATISVEPHKLRNSKVVGEENEEDKEGEEAEEAAVEEVTADADNIDVDAEGETDEDEIMEDDGQ